CIRTDIGVGNHIVHVCLALIDVDMPVTWASVRLLLAGVNQFMNPVPEGHVAAQLGLGGTLLSLAVLFCGIYLWKFRKSVFQ
ncbi:hypothetical protein, partial [Psychroserpens mesophilus]|uniref:hypothetical protein n=1 Tax=Psychroserpens mesophilus TaxID=325473 RepID=UPI003D649344